MFQTRTPVSKGIEQQWDRTRLRLLEAEREQAALDWLYSIQRTLKRTRINEEIIRGPFAFLGGIPFANRDNLLAVYQTLLKLNAPLQRDFLVSDLAQSDSIFPRLLHAGWEAVIPFCPTLKLLAEKKDRERAAIEERQRHEEGAPAKGTWINGSWYPEGMDFPNASRDFAGLTQASKRALDDVGRRQLERNTTR
jgi:hypothetical protein